LGFDLAVRLVDLDPHVIEGKAEDRSTVGTNLRDINRWAQAMITEAGAQSCYVDYEPPFGRGPFGHYICTSVNDAVLHGRPHDYTLADGDLLTLDLAVSKGGVVADSAISFIVGDSKPSEQRRSRNPHLANAGAAVRSERPVSLLPKHFTANRW